MNGGPWQCLNSGCRQWNMPSRSYCYACSAPHAAVRMQDDALTSFAEVNPSAFARATLAQVKARPGFYECPHGRAVGFCPLGCDVPHVEHGFEFIDDLPRISKHE